MLPQVTVSNPGAGGAREAARRDNRGVMHSERLLEHFRNPRNVGQLPPPANTVDVTNPACGDLLRLSARFENGRVAEARYQVRGCTASIAAGSALTEWMAGKSREELRSLTPAVIEEAVGGLEAASKHAAALCVDGAKRLAEVS
jgi:nitrogen fixation protein NifU and related proteins